MAAEPVEPMDPSEPPEQETPLGDLSITEVLARARQATDELARRLSGPTTLDAFERVVPAPPDRGWAGLSSVAPIAPGETAHGPDFVAPPPTFADGSLPVIHREVEDLGRVLTAVHTSLAGHAARAMEDGVLREPLLGIPGGARPFRDAPDWMVQTLRIARPEARRRIRRARHVQPPPPELSGHVRDADHPILGQAFREGAIDPAALDLISHTLQETRRDAEAAGAEAQLTERWLADGEHTLTGQARILDPDSMRHACTRWRQWAQHALNPDGPEPSDAMPQVHQGLSYQGKRRSLHYWKILADDLQHEVLSTIAGAAGNPRARRPDEGGTAEEGPMLDAESPADSRQDDEQDARQDGQQDNQPDDQPDDRQSDRQSDRQDEHAWDGAADLSTDPRTTHQRQLDGLTSALMGALSLTDGHGLPDSGGGRPLVMVTIDYQTLLDQWMSSAATGTADPPAPSHPPGSLPFELPAELPNAPSGPPGPPELSKLPAPSEPTGPSELSGPSDLSAHAEASFRAEAAFTGPISPQTIRTLACDADLLPVVLGGAGQVLDAGRTQRLFPARLRKAITARDGGCSAPGCTMPAPWTEVHHIQWWTRGGPTSVDNGVLLCSRHHTAVHSGSWDITVEDGVPWFVPAPFIDPFRTPRRNHYWRP